MNILSHCSTCSSGHLTKNCQGSCAEIGLESRVGEYLIEILIAAQGPVQPDSGSGTFGELEASGIGQQWRGDPVGLISGFWPLFRIGDAINQVYTR